VTFRKLDDGHIICPMATKINREEPKGILMIVEGRECVVKPSVVEQ